MRAATTGGGVRVRSVRKHTWWQSHRPPEAVSDAPPRSLAGNIIDAVTKRKLATMTALDNSPHSSVKRPRGRPPLGAILTPEGRYELPPEAVEAAAERMIRHREACRQRYAATRQGLLEAKPELFKKRKRHCSLDEFSSGTAANLG